MWQRYHLLWFLRFFCLSTLTLCIKLQFTKIFISLSLRSAVDEIFNRFDIRLWKIETWVQHVIWELPITTYRGGWLFGFNNLGTCARADRPAWHEIVADYTHTHTQWGGACHVRPSRPFITRASPIVNISFAIVGDAIWHLHFAAACVKCVRAN